MEGDKTLSRFGSMLIMVLNLDPFRTVQAKFIVPPTVRHRYGWYRWPHMVAGALQGRGGLCGAAAGSRGLAGAAGASRGLARASRDLARGRSTPVWVVSAASCGRGGLVRPCTEPWGARLPRWGLALPRTGPRAASAGPARPRTTSMGPRLRGAQ